MAEKPFVNPYWETVARATPRLHDQAVISRQVVRGKVWHIIENSLTGRQFRATPEAYCLIGLLDGDRTVEAAMAAAERILGSSAPGQGEVLRLLTQMHAAGLISNAGQVSRGATLFERAATARQRKILQQLRSPLAIRIPLVDPDRFLDRIAPFARLVFSSLGFFVWLTMVGCGAGFALVHWDEITDGLIDRIFAADNVVAMAAVFAVMKLLHEIGHGMAVKRWGGDVHELGLMLLVFIPVPYVDATAANRFQSRFRRIVVSSAGMYVETFLAAGAILLWGQMEQGLARAILFNAALIGSVSTLLFNINPLLKFDGYYIFSDAVEIPNLATRGTAYCRYLLEKFVLFVRDATTVEDDKWEKAWLLAYTVAATVYRLFIVLAIALFVSQKFFFVGVVLAAWAVAQMLLFPLLKAVAFLAVSPKLKKRRAEAWLGAVAFSVVVGTLLFVVPAPRTTYTQGVVWVPEEGEIVAATDGFVQEVIPREGSRVAEETVLVTVENMALQTELERLFARRSALTARYGAQFVADRVAARMTRMEIEQTNRRLAWVGERLDGLEVKARTSGIFALAVPEDMLGRYVQRGQLLGFVISPDESTIRFAIRQQDIGLIRQDVLRIEIMAPGSERPPVEAHVVREIPQATNELPSVALTKAGGGPFEATSDESGAVIAVEDLFHFELRADANEFQYRVGQKIHIKFVHSWEAAGFQVWRRLRQLFLSNLHV